MSDNFSARRSAFLRRLYELATAKGDVFASFHQYNDIGRPLGLDQETTMNLAVYLHQKQLIDGTHDLDVWLTSAGLDSLDTTPQATRDPRSYSNMNEMPPTFVAYAADILADTDNGLSGPQFVKVALAYSVQWDVPIPHPTYPFGTNVPNKRTALYDNLMAFDPAQRYRIIRELCDHPTMLAKAPKAAQTLKLVLVARYGQLADETLGSELDEALVERTQHFLGPFPDALALYEQAVKKHASGIFLRNVLDDLRLALELLLRSLSTNDKALENQISTLGTFIKQKGGSSELANMFVKLVDYYTKYQNSYVKHDDAVIEEEVEFIFELTSSFMKHLVRLSYRGAV